MGRQAKVLVGLALLLVPLASGVQGAAAVGFDAASFPVTMTGQQVGSGLVFGTEAGSATCKSTTMTSPSIGGYAESVNFSPLFSGCTAFGALPATVTTTGCTLAMPGPTELAVNEFEGSVNLSCEAGKSIVVSAVTCELQIPAQTGLKAVKYVDRAEEKVPNFTAALALGGIKYTVTKDGFLCPFAGTGAKAGGTLGGEVLVKASNGLTLQGASVKPQAKLCTAVPTGTPAVCPEGSGFKGKKLTGTVAPTDAIWSPKAGPLEVRCVESSISLELSETGWSPAGGGVTGWSFSTKGGPCIATFGPNAPIVITFENLSFDATTAAYGVPGRLTVGKTENIPVQVKMVNTLPNGWTCIYRPKKPVTAKWINGTKAFASELAFSGEFALHNGANCYPEFELDAAYKITQPDGTGIYIASK